MVIDVSLCHDCNNCFIACKDEFVSNDWLPYSKAQPRHGHRWMNIERKERGQYPRIDCAFLPMPCQHCSDAPCVKDNPDCIEKRDDGIVLIDPVKSKGKKGVVESCPYGAIYWNDAEDIPQKCTMCAHLLDNEWEGKKPRCAHSCPTGAMEFYTVEKAEMDKIIAAEGLEQYRSDELKSDPNVYYKNLYKFTKHFITGGVLKDGDCAEGVTVSLTGGADAEQKTNYFGDFKFDGLLPGTYTISIGGKKIQTVTIDESLNMGVITI
jgi:Fe-S-cluster-containing dehydrogenase component